MKEMSTSQIKTLSNVFTENQMKVVEKLEKMSEQDKETARKNFDINSPHSPLHEARKIVDSLRSINATLKEGNQVGLIKELIGSKDSPKTGVTMSAELVGRINNGIDAKMSKLDSEIASASRNNSDTTDLRQEKNLLQKLVKSTERLAEQTKKIRADVGGEKDPGKFRT
jgi:hypothetical protein